MMLNICRDHLPRDQSALGLMV